MWSTEDIAQVRKWNRMLDLLPRIRLRGPRDFRRLQRLLELGQALFGLRAANVECRTVEVAGRVPVGVRVQRPASVRGVVLDFHGGAFVNGNARMDDRSNRQLVERAGLAVVSVDYRLSNGRGLDASIDDCLTAALWMAEHVSSEWGCSQFLITGESSGAYLALQSLLRLPDRSVCRGALLYYGIYDLRGTPSLRSAGRGAMMLEMEDIRGLAGLLLPGEDLGSGELSPLNADLSGLPPALLIVGGRDGLLDDSRLLAQRWPGADLLEVPESPHGFNRFGTSVARKTLDYALAWISRQVA